MSHVTEAILNTKTRFLPTREWQLTAQLVFITGSWYAKYPTKFSSRNLHTSQAFSSSRRAKAATSHHAKNSTVSVDVKPTSCFGVPLKILQQGFPAIFYCYYT